MKEYAILIIGLVIAIIEIDKLSFKDPHIRPWIIFLCSVLVAVYGVLQVRDKQKDEKYSKNTGVLKPNTAYSNELFWVVDGDTLSFPNGVFELQDLFPGWDINNKRPASEKPFEGVDFRAWLQDGKIKVNSTIRDTSGNVIAQIQRNEWLVNSSTISLDRNFDDKALEVKDAVGQIVFQVEIDGNQVKMQGKFVKPNKELGIVLGFKGIGFTLLLEPGSYHIVSQSPTLAIKPIFKYPSAEHKGERDHH
jgi:hypothetical protein